MRAIEARRLMTFLRMKAGNTPATRRPSEGRPRISSSSAKSSCQCCPTPRASNPFAHARPPFCVSPQRHRDSRQVIKLSEVVCGVGNVLQNKGGIGAYLRVDRTTFLFVAAHLAAHQAWRRSLLILSRQCVVQYYC